LNARIQQFTIAALLSVSALFSATSNAQMIFTNGGLNPQANTESGVAATAGFFWSEVQHDTGNTTVGNAVSGFAALQGTNRIADDFVVPAGQTWTVTGVDVYAYQTGSPATPSPFNGATLQIHNGRPGDAGVTVVFGDITTNRFGTSTDTTYFRIFNTAVPAPGTPSGTTRKIWRNRITVSPALTLTAGTYWIDWAMTSTNAAAFFAPSVTIAGARTRAGANGRQLAVATSTWADLLDTGNPVTPPSLNQDMPFEIIGTTTGGTNTVPTLTYAPTTAAGVTFPAGTAGAATSTIAITSAGAAGTGQSAVTGCAITGAGAASFGAVTTTPAGGIFNTATTSGSINLSCTRAAAAATASLACTETATPTVAGSPFTRTWALTCPAATVTNTAPVLAVAATTLAAGAGTVTPTITTAATGTGSTVFACSIPATAPSNFLITSNATQTVTTTAAGIGMSCVPQPAATTATLTCTQTATPAPNPANATATITCPVAAATVTAGTVSGTTITLPSYGLPISSSSAALSFTSNGNASVLNCTATGAGFSIAPNPLNLATGVAGTATVTYTGTAVGTFTGNVTCTTTSAGGPFTYPLSVTVTAQPATFRQAPALSSGNTWLLILGTMGFGLLLLGARRRS
jgi:hypothetical protein